MKRLLQILTCNRYGQVWGKYSKCKVSTLSSLATAFNARPSSKLSLPFKETSGLFGIPELRSYDGFYQLKENVEAETEKLIAESCSSTRSRKMVEVFDELSDTLCRVADLAEFVRLAHPQSSFAQAAEEACISISGVVEKLNTNRELFLALQDVVKNGDKFPTTDIDKHVASLFLFDFEQCGIHLAESERRQVVALNDYILQVGQRFMAGALNPRTVPKQAIPHNLRKYFNEEEDRMVINGLFSDALDERVRETAYKVFLLPDHDQEHLLNEMLTARFRLARICGFPTYAHRALNLSLAETPAMVSAFLDKLSEELRPRAQAEYDTMLQIKQQISPTAKELCAWDIAYIGNRAKVEWLNAKNSDFSAYFSLGTCMHGLNMLMNHLFGISLVNEPILPGEAWAPDIYKLAVTHETEGLLGYIYCDFYERTNKPNQDCHFTIRGGKLLDNGTYQNPVVVVMLNVPTPQWAMPSLLTPSMVDNLFHEMGHAMHSMLARTQYQHVTGTRCTTDFAEVPSVLMEYFAADPRVLRMFARHYVTQEAMPEPMLQRMCAAKNLFSASEMQVQVLYSLLDQEYHSKHPLEGTTTQVLARTHNSHYGIPYVPNTAWELRFSHLVGYGAKYYSYLMSRAVASWIWQSYFKQDPLCRAQGDKYRRDCLAHGGGKPARALVADLLAVAITPDNLAEALILDLDSHAALFNAAPPPCLSL